MTRNRISQTIKALIRTGDSDLAGLIAKCAMGQARAEIRVKIDTQRKSLGTSDFFGGTSEAEDRATARVILSQKMLVSIEAIETLDAGRLIPATAAEMFR